MHFFWLASWPSRTAASNTFPPDQPPYHPQHQLFLVPCSEHPPIATAHPLESWDHETTAKPDNTNNIPPHIGHQAARSKCGHDVGIVFSELLSCAFSSRLTVRFFQLWIFFWSAQTTHATQETHHTENLASHSTHHFVCAFVVKLGQGLLVWACLGLTCSLCLRLCVFVGLEVCGGCGVSSSVALLAIVETLGVVVPIETHPIFRGLFSGHTAKLCIDVPKSQEQLEIHRNWLSKTHQQEHF